jgi:flagellar basal body rod protein FlgG
MLRGIYSVANAMEAASRTQELAAENLTHAATPGYRRQGTHFTVAASDGSLEAATQHLPASRTFSHIDTGPVQQTDNPYDLAIIGNGFFALDGPNGTMYTRNGGFQRGPDGQLQTRGGGYTVRGGVNIPADASRIAISADGTVSADGAPVGQIELATIANPDTMRRVGDTLFESATAQPAAQGEIRVEQGYREGSNVQPVQEMVAMMVGMRQYEAAERALRSMSDAIQQNTRMQQ